MKKTIIDVIESKSQIDPFKRGDLVIYKDTKVKGMVIGKSTSTGYINVAAFSTCHDQYVFIADWSIDNIEHWTGTIKISNE